MVEAYKISDILQRIRVLVVDDDAMVRSIVAEFLRSWGFAHVEEAPNSRQALKLLANKKNTYDLVLSDWQMPGLDGLQLYQQMRMIPFRENTKFIMITSQVPEERIKIAKARAAGITTYVVKPFQGELLKEKVWSALGWTTSNDDLSGF